MLRAVLQLCDPRENRRRARIGSLTDLLRVFARLFLRGPAIHISAIAATFAMKQKSQSWKICEWRGLPRFVTVAGLADSRRTIAESSQACPRPCWQDFSRASDSFYCCYYNYYQIPPFARARKPDENPPDEGAISSPLRRFEGQRVLISRYPGHLMRKIF